MKSPELEIARRLETTTEPLSSLEFNILAAIVELEQHPGYIGSTVHVNLTMALVIARSMDKKEEPEETS